MNDRDSEAVAAMLQQRGYSMVNNEHDADVVLLNTCAVRDQAEQKAIGKTGHLLKHKRRNSNLIIGIMGCMAQNRGDSILDQLPDLDLLVGTQKFHRVPDHLDNLIRSYQAQGPQPQQQGRPAMTATFHPLSSPGRPAVWTKLHLAAARRAKGA